MAGEQADQVATIISALNNAGLLATNAPSSTAQAAEIIGVLGKAGLLGIGVLTTPEPPIGPQAGDQINIGPIRIVTRYCYPATAEVKAWVGLMVIRPGNQQTSYGLRFPPNDDSFLAEIDKYIAAPATKDMSARVEITEAFAGGGYDCLLHNLYLNYYNIPQ